MSQFNFKQTLSREKKLQCLYVLIATKLVGKILLETNERVTR